VGSIVNEWLSNLMQQLRALPPARALALGLTAAGSIAFFVWIGVGANRAEYRLLFGGLEEDQALQVVQALEAEKIPYRLERGGTAVAVPGPLVYEARIRVAGRGLPGGGSAGFEIFDQAGFGVSDFIQQVNFQRALQGELARSIEQLEPVERARVQIAMPERTAFVRQETQQGSASVVVRLRPGAELEPAQVRGVVHLVASSVPRLEAGRVTIVDTAGRLLAPLEDGPAGARAPAGALAQEKSLERELAQRVESILERTVGAGRVVAHVRADLDWAQAEHTEERFDPDSQVARSEQRSTESSNDESGRPEGVPGVRSNQPGAAAEAALEKTASSSSRTSETTNYEISKVVSHRVDPVGTIKRLDVAVLVDGRPAPEPAAEGAEAPAGEAAGFVPWSEEEIKQFEALAMRAVGFDPERGDRITVTSAPFRSVPLGAPQGGLDLDPNLLLLAGTVLNFLGWALAALLFARFVGKPLVSALTTRAPAVRGGGLPLTAAEFEASLGGSPAQAAFAGAAPAELEPPRSPLTLAEQVTSIAHARRDDSVKTLRGWLDQ